MARSPDPRFPNSRMSIPINLERESANGSDYYHRNLFLASREQNRTEICKPGRNARVEARAKKKEVAREEEEIDEWVSVRSWNFYLPIKCYLLGKNLLAT